MDFAVSYNVSATQNEARDVMKWFTVFLLAALFTSTTFASTPSSQDNAKWDNWPTVGKSSLSWFIFKIFKSELKTPSGFYEESLDISPHPMALSIVYQRDITKEQLIEATQSQWDYLGYSKNRQKEWLDELQRIYPNVRKGERLVYVTDGSTGEIHFFSEQSGSVKLGEIASESMNDAFLSIWLAPETEYPKHREKLIGSRKK